MNFSIAIDGPAGAGKSTIAKLVGEKFNLMYINTGSMYRAVTLFALRNNIGAHEIDKLIKLINSLNMHFEGERLIVNDEDISEEIRMPVISENVSMFSSIREVREILVDLQKEMAKHFNVIMDGRDIGTVVLCDSPYKFYLTASAEKRAERRYNELIVKGISVKYNDILSDIIRRDSIDSTREVSPLTKAEDAIEIDTSNMNIKQVVDKIASYIKL